MEIHLKPRKEQDMSPENKENKRFKIVDFPPLWKDYDDVNECCSIGGPPDLTQIIDWLDRNNDAKTKEKK